MSCASGLNDQLVCKNVLPFQILSIERNNILLLLLLFAFSLMHIITPIPNWNKLGISNWSVCVNVASVL